MDLGGNELQTTGAITICKALCKTSSLIDHELCFKSNGIGEGAADDIADFLSANFKLQVLDLSDNELQTTGTIKISRALCKISSPTELYIMKNGIGEGTADSIVAALTSFTRLQVLDLGCNNLQTAGIIRISKALQSVPTLLKFNVSSSEHLAEESPYIASCCFIKHQNI